jgi:uncharacterized membrane protein YdjX (TVP38/TMEM64 family)
MELGVETVFWGGIFVALTATAIAMVAIYYFVRWLLYTLSRRRTSGGNRSDRNLF